MYLFFSWASIHSRRIPCPKSYNNRLINNLNFLRFGQGRDAYLNRLYNPHTNLTFVPYPSTATQGDPEGGVARNRPIMGVADPMPCPNVLSYQKSTLGPSNTGISILSHTLRHHVRSHRHLQSCTVQIHPHCWSTKDTPPSQ